MTQTTKKPNSVTIGETNRTGRKQVFEKRPTIKGNGIEGDEHQYSYYGASQWFTQADLDEVSDFVRAKNVPIAAKMAKLNSKIEALEQKLIALREQVTKLDEKKLRGLRMGDIKEGMDAVRTVGPHLQYRTVAGKLVKFWNDDGTPIEEEMV